MLVQKKASSKKTLTLLVVVSVLVVLIFLIATNRLQVPGLGSDETIVDESSLMAPAHEIAPVNDSVTESVPTKTAKSEDYSLFEDSVYNKLEEVPGVNLIPEETGKSNPFDANLEF